MYACMLCACKCWKYYKTACPNKNIKRKYEYFEIYVLENFEKKKDMDRTLHIASYKHDYI